MRTLIQGGWVVGFDGHEHELLPNGVVVYEDNRIVHVGYRFDGQVDREVDARGKLLSPGLINCHIHADANARHTLLNDPTKTNYFGQNFLSYGAAVRGTRQPPREAEIGGKFGVWAAVRGGATTILDVGTPPHMAERFTEIVGELGVRAYLSPVFRSGAYVFDQEHRIQWDWDPPAGEAGLERARKYIQQHHGSHNDRIRGLLYPGQADTCTPELLRAAKQAAADLGVGIQLHASMNLVEFQSSLRERQVTPIQFLDQIGFLGPEVILGHCVFHSGHSWTHYPYANDLQIVADSGASVAHAPYKYAKQGLALESFERYRKHGINLAIGTDTFPQDLINEMRLAGLLCRVVDGNFLVGKAHDVFDAATLGGARALGRDDLGRLAPGARADLLVIDLQQANYGGVRDPIKALVDGGSGGDIEMIVVDGETLVEQRRATRFDEAALLQQVQRVSEEFWASVAQWRGGRTVNDIAPLSYPIRPDS